MCMIIFASLPKLVRMLTLQAVLWKEKQGVSVTVLFAYS